MDSRSIAPPKYPTYNGMNMPMNKNGMSKRILISPVGEGISTNEIINPVSPKIKKKTLSNLSVLTSRGGTLSILFSPVSCK
jgi:hypothetical protein